MEPIVGSAVHYVSFGTPGGEYPPMCRAAVVTEVGQWVTVQTVKAQSYSRSGGWPIRTLEQWFIGDAVALTVFNPTGLFLNGAGPVACKHVEPVSDKPLEGGTWHWPERTEE